MSQLRRVHHHVGSLSKASANLSSDAFKHATRLDFRFAELDSVKMPCLFSCKMYNDGICLSIGREVDAGLPGLKCEAQSVSRGERE